MIDARRMEVYAAVYDHNRSEVAPTRAEIVTEDSFASWAAAGPVHLLGNGAEKCREVLKHPNFRFHTGIQPSARELGLLAADRYEIGQIEDLALSAAINKALIDVGPDIAVCVDNQTAFIETEAAICAEESFVKEIKEVVETFEGISDVKIDCHPIVALSE